MTAPEPVEVAGDDLAAADHWLRKGLIIGNGKRLRDVLMAEYDRRGARVTALERELADLVRRVNLCTGHCTSDFDDVLERSETLLGLPFGYTDE